MKNKIDNKGMTIAEILVSILLISIVLIFLMNLLVKIRNIYNNNKMQTEYLLFQSTVIKAINDDLNTCNLDSLTVENSVDISNSVNSIFLNFTDCNKKKLEIKDNVLKYVSMEEGCYGQGKCKNDIIRKAPDKSYLKDIGVIKSLDNSEYTYIKNGKRLYRIYIPFYDEYDTDYTINVYALKNADSSDLFNYLDIVDSIPDETTPFLGGNVPRKDYEEIYIKNSISIPNNALDKWDVSRAKNGSIMAWNMDIDDDGKYELYVGQDGGVNTNINSRYLFGNFVNVTNIDLSGINTSHTVNFSYFFWNCRSLSTVDITPMNTSNATNMRLMFGGRNSSMGFTSLDLRTLDTSKVTDMAAMFQRCEKLKNLDLSTWDVSNVKNFHNMFYACYLLKEINFTGWDTSSATIMAAMFWSNFALTNPIGIGNFDTSNVIDMSSIFSGCGNSSNCEGHYDETMNINKLNISQWNTSNVISMSAMFYKCSKLSEIDLSTWQTSKLENTRLMFYKAGNGTTKVDMSNFNFKNTTTYDSMFLDSNIDEIKINSVSKSFIESRLKEVSKTATILTE